MSKDPQAIDPRTRETRSRRAPRAEGPRTTLRVPAPLAASTERLARDLGISRNDALLRLASRGAELYELEARIAERREARWSAVVPSIVDVDTKALPSPEEARAALLADEPEPDQLR